MFKDKESARKLKRWGRIRRVKKMLRPLPRRANVHRYPILKWFAAKARRKYYLWSFRREYLVPSFYAGSIIALLPLFGIQFVLGIVMAIILRSNLMVMTALVFITNYLTVVPIYYLNTLIGKFLFELVSNKTVPLSLSPTGIMKLLSAQSGKDFFTFFTLCSIGGIILGYILGLTLSLLHKWYIVHLSKND